MRFFNTNSRGRAFDPATIEAVWRKGVIVIGYDPSSVRKDACGAFIYRTHYGNTSSQFGWEIDHVMPVSKGGSDHLGNLQPLQWANNRHKNDIWPNWTCLIKAA